MENPVLTKQKIYQALQVLPPADLEQVAGVISQLRLNGVSSPPLCLGGLWNDIPFDVNDRDIRNLRRHLSRK